MAALGAAVGGGAEVVAAVVAGVMAEATVGDLVELIVIEPEEDQARDAPKQEGKADGQALQFECDSGLGSWW